MGASASALVNPTSPEAVSDPKTREQLDVLLKLTDARLDAYQKELEMMFVDGDSQSPLSLFSCVYMLIFIHCRRSEAYCPWQACSALQPLRRRRRREQVPVRCG